MKSKFMLFALTLLIASPTLSFAKKRPMQEKNMQGEKHEMMMSMFEGIELSKEQKANIDKIHEAAKADREKNWAKMEAVKNEMKAAMQKDASEAELRAIFEKKQNLRQEMAKSRFENLLKMRAQLTPEQRKKAQMHMHQHKDKMGHKGDRMKKMKTMQGDEKVAPMDSDDLE